MLTVTTPIPVYAGDDWAFEFAAATSVGTPLDLTGCVVVGELVADRLAAPLDLTADTLRADILDPAAGRFALGAEAAVTVALTAPCNAGLQIVLLQADGRRHTVGSWPILVLPPVGFVAVTPSAGAVLADPLTGATVTFIGPSGQLPGRLPRLDFTLPPSSQYLGLL